MIITESTTRSELIARIRRLELEVMNQAEKIQDIEFLPHMVKSRKAADTMADLGRIHNTPHAKNQWISGN